MSQLIPLRTILFPTNKGKFTSSFLSVNPMKHLQRNSSQDSILLPTTSISLFPGGKLGRPKASSEQKPPTPIDQMWFMKVNALVKKTTWVKQ